MPAVSPMSAAPTSDTVKKTWNSLRFGGTLVISVHSTLAKKFVFAANEFVDNIFLYASSVKGYQ